MGGSGKPTSRYVGADVSTTGAMRIIETPPAGVARYIRNAFGFSATGNIRRQVKERLGGTRESPLADFLATKCGEVVHYPDAFRAWKGPAIREAEELLRKESIDAIISSSSPVTSHIIGCELRRRHGIPWLADLRDLWSQNHNYYYGELRMAVDRNLELRTLISADALVTVSKPWAEKLARLHGRDAVYTITNGFDPEMLSEGETELTSRFTITYTGTIYRTKQDPGLLLSAIRELMCMGILDPNDVDVRFYGPVEGWIGRKIRECGLEDVARQYGEISRGNSIERQRESQILLLLNWNDTEERGCYPLKVFEYLGAKRPILAVGGSGDDVVSELLRETSAGIYCSDYEEIRENMSMLYYEYKAKGRIEHHGDMGKIGKYSYRESAKAYVEVLESVRRESL